MTEKNLKINNTNVIEILDIPYSYIEEKQKEFFEKKFSFKYKDLYIEDFDTKILKTEKEEEEYEEIFNEFYEWQKNNLINYFTPYLIATYLLKHFNINDDKKIDVTKYYFKENDLNKLRNIDSQFLKKSNPYYSDTQINKEMSWLYLSCSGYTIFDDKKYHKDETSDFNDFEDSKMFLLDGYIR